MAKSNDIEITYKIEKVDVKILEKVSYIYVEYTYKGETHKRQFAVKAEEAVNLDKFEDKLRLVFAEDIKFLNQFEELRDSIGTEKKIIYKAE